ncbi:MULTISPECIES: hypothetical protein [Salinibaculum]|uniref:hypothetical protein n=1 Tax=Salinibaculum TaxID=2732368 RepID=UPI0030D12FE8
MAESTLGTIEELLNSTMEETDDAEVHYKLRSAQQLLEVVQQRHDNLDHAIEDAVTDGELRENLSELGYLE